MTKKLSIQARPTAAKDVAEGKMTPAKWRRFLELIAAGVARAAAERAIELSSYTTQIYLITVAKAKDEYREAQLEWVRREMDPEVIDGVLTAIAEGSTVTAAAAQFMIKPEKFHSWVMRDPLLTERYEEARKIQAEMMLDEMIQISDDGGNDKIHDDNGRVRVDYDVVQRSRLRLEQRRWHMSKVNPHKFSDKMQIDQKIETTVNHVEKLDAARRRKEEAAKLRASKPDGEQHVTH